MANKFLRFQLNPDYKQACTLASIVRRLNHTPATKERNHGMQTNPATIFLSLRTWIFILFPPMDLEFSSGISGTTQR